MKGCLGIEAISQGKPKCHNDKSWAATVGHKQRIKAAEQRKRRAERGRALREEPGSPRRSSTGRRWGSPGQPDH